MMKFLVDENVGFSIVNYLRDQGFDVKTVSEFFPSREDIYLFQKAYQEERIIVTNDKDFGYLIFKTQLPPPSIILFRLKDESPQENINALKQVLNLPLEKIHNHLIVISEKKIRIRAL